MNVLKHVCRISLCITRRLSNLSTQTSSFHPTLQTFPLFPPASIFKFYNVPSSAASLWTSLLLHPTVNHPVNGRDSTRRSLSRTKKQKHALRAACAALEVSWMNNPDCFDSIFIIWGYDETPLERNLALPPFCLTFLIITCSSFMDRPFCCRETSQYSLATTTYSFTYNLIPLFFCFSFFYQFLKILSECQRSLMEINSPLQLVVTSRRSLDAEPPIAFLSGSGDEVVLQSSRHGV